MSRALSAALAVAVALAAACDGAVGTIRVTLATAPDSDVMDPVVRARLSLSDPPTVSEVERDAEGRLILDLEVVAKGPAGVLTFEGFDAGGALVAYGRSGPLPIAAIDAVVVIYVAAPLGITEAPEPLDPPRSELAVTLLPYGVAIAGGRDASGAPADEMSIYNVYTHGFQHGDPLPEPRAAMTAVTGAFGRLYLFGGLGDDDEPTQSLWRFDTNVAPAGRYDTMLVEAGLARAGASAAPLGQDAFLVTGDPAAMIDGIGERIRALDGRPQLQGAAATVTILGVPHTLVAGRDAGDTGAALFVTNELVALDAPASVRRSGHSAVAIPGGVVLVVGGATDEGPARDGLLFDATAGTFSVVPELLTTGRRDAAVAATADYLLVAGGTDGDDEVLADAEIFDAATLAPVTVVPLLVPRTGANAAALPDGRVLIVGGLDADGAPTTVIELFTPAPATF